MSNMTESFKEVTRTLEQLPQEFQQKVVVGATRASTKVIAVEAERLAPEKTGTLKMSIGVAKAKKKHTKENHVKFYVVPKSKIVKKIKAKVGGEDATLKVKTSIFYPSLQEFGTSKMAANPFLRPAVMNTEKEAVDAFKNYVFRRTPIVLKKLKK